MSKIFKVAPKATTTGEPPAGVPGPTRPGLPVQRRAGIPADRNVHVVTDPSGVTVESPAGTVATARVSEHGDEVVIEFSTASPGLPDALRRKLVDRAFDHDAVRAGRPILVCVPRGDSEVLRQSRRHVQEESAHVAGVTCLINGRVGSAGPARERR